MSPDQLPSSFWVLTMKSRQSSNKRFASASSAGFMVVNERVRSRGMETVSVTPSRIAENFNVWDFRLDKEELGEIAKLDQGKRLGPDPDQFGG